MEEIYKISSLGCIFSCSKVEISKAEISAVGKVLEFYGVEINRFYGSQNQNVTPKHFELKASKSELLNNDLQHLTEYSGILLISSTRLWYLSNPSKMKSE